MNKEKETKKNDLSEDGFEIKKNEFSSTNTSLEDALNLDDDLDFDPRDLDAEDLKVSLKSDLDFNLDDEFDSEDDLELENIKDDAFDSEDDLELENIKDDEFDSEDDLELEDIKDDEFDGEIDLEIINEGNIELENIKDVVLETDLEIKDNEFDGEINLTTNDTDLDSETELEELKDATLESELETDLDNSLNSVSNELSVDDLKKVEYKESSISKMLKSKLFLMLSYGTVGTVLIVTIATMFYFIGTNVSDNTEKLEAYAAKSDVLLLQTKSNVENLIGEVNDLKKENKRLKKDAANKIYDIKKNIKKIKNKQIKIENKGLSERDIDNIIKRVEYKTGASFSSYKENLKKLNNEIQNNKNYIKKTFQISLGVLDQIQKMQTSQVKSEQMLKEQIKSLNGLKSEMSNSNHLATKVSKIEKDLSILKKVKKQVYKKEIKIPIKITVKKRIARKIKKKYYLTGAFDNTVYLKESDSTDNIVLYSVGDHIEGYGTITSISNAGVVKTSGGIVRY